MYVYPDSNQTLKGNGTDQEKQQYLTFPPFSSTHWRSQLLLLRLGCIIFCFSFYYYFGEDVVVDTYHTASKSKNFPLFFLLFHAILNDYFVGSLNNNNNKKSCSCKFSLKTRISTRSFFKIKKKMINERFSIIKTPGRFRHTTCQKTTTKKYRR
jgi:hypothetical protein